MTNNSGTYITVLENDHGLISKQHMRRVLMLPIVVPAYQHAAVAVVVRSKSGASVWMSQFERNPAATKHPWTMWTTTGRPVLLISSTLILDLRIWKKTRSPFDVDVFNTLRPRQNARHFSDAIFKRNFLKRKYLNSD